ncbi:Protein Kinase C Beta Type [Manis pentadactyla]|nr:Protein Kinase C Beta Type [Manis pentadactyla]
MKTNKPTKVSKEQTRDTIEHYNINGNLNRKILIIRENKGNAICTYWNQGYGYQQGYGPGYGGSDDSPHGYYGYGPGYYYRNFHEVIRANTYV